MNSKPEVRPARSLIVRLTLHSPAHAIALLGTQRLQRFGVPASILAAGGSYELVLQQDELPELMQALPEFIGAWVGDELWLSVGG